MSYFVPALCGSMMSSICCSRYPCIPPKLLWPTARHRNHLLAQTHAITRKDCVGKTCEESGRLGTAVKGQISVRHLHEWRMDLGGPSYEALWAQNPASLRRKP